MTCMCYLKSFRILHQGEKVINEILLMFLPWELPDSPYSLCHGFSMLQNGSYHPPLPPQQPACVSVHAKTTAANT
jgi:hypothetical protein